MRLYVEKIGWYVARGGVCHERFPPETQQGLRCPVGWRIRKDEGDILTESAPMRFLHFAMPVAGVDLRQNLRLPEALLSFIENELDGGYLGIFNSRT